MRKSDGLVFQSNNALVSLLPTNRLYKCGCQNEILDVELKAVNVIIIMQQQQQKKKRRLKTLSVDAAVAVRVTASCDETFCHVGCCINTFRDSLVAQSNINSPSLSLSALHKTLPTSQKDITATLCWTLDRSRTARPTNQIGIRNNFLSLFPPLQCVIVFYDFRLDFVSKD